MSRGNNEMTIDTKALLSVTHDEAREILSRFNNSPFRNHNIPVNPECDVVLRLGPYIDQCEASANHLEELEEQLHLANIDALQTEAERVALEAENNRLRAQQASLNGTINKLRRENKRLTGHLRVIATTNQGLGVARRYAKQALAEGGGK